jgi:hypothetical protein
MRRTVSPPAKRYSAIRGAGARSTCSRGDKELPNELSVE